MQRVPLPHIFPSDASALNMRIRKSATLEGQMQISPSEPTDRWRGLTYSEIFPGLGSIFSMQFTYT